jgi:L-ascorbate metabolism protein UlaG (beta-lactamase superfamily)
MTLKAPTTRDQALTREVESYCLDQKDFHLWWLGQSGFLLLWKGTKILMDPYLSDSLTKKYAQTDRPHVRLSERVVDPDLLRGIYIASSSHNHTDHLDQETLGPILKNNPDLTLLIGEANRDFVADRLQIPRDRPLGLTSGAKISVGEFSFFGVAAKHNEIERDQAGNCKCLGYVIRFGEWTIYHSGDTLWYQEMEDALRPFRIDVALLPINGNDPSRGVAGNLSPKEAAALGKAIGARLVIPCHYDMFAFNTADPEEFAQEAAKIDQPYQILELGGHFSSAYFSSRYT